MTPVKVMAENQPLALANGDGLDLYIGSGGVYLDKLALGDAQGWKPVTFLEVKEMRSLAKQLTALADWIEAEPC